METRISRVNVSSSSMSRSRSPISDSERRSVSTSRRRGPSTPVKSSIQRNDSDEEQDPHDREFLALDDVPKTIIDETSSPLMSDTDEIHHRKRSHHRHHHHRQHKQPKSNKRSITHHRQSVKRRYSVFFEEIFYEILFIEILVKTKQCQQHVIINQMMKIL